MVTGGPEMPRGVRPVVGDHVAPLALPRGRRELRAAVNLATVAAARVRPRAVALPQAPPYAKLFVVGCARSGTSWVQEIVSSHPAVVSSSESHAYETIYEPVKARGAHSVVAWTKVLHRHDMSEREARWVGLHWWVNRRSLIRFIEWAMADHGLDAAATAEAVIEAVFDSYYLEKAGPDQRALLEKTPGHLAYASRILDRFPEARIIEVVRDGRDVCVSLQMQALTARWAPKDRRAQIAMWVRAIERGRALRRDTRFEGRVHTVRYEELKAAPEAEIERLLAFAGLDADAAMVADIADRVDFRHRAAHPVVGAGHHHRRGEVGDWREHFSAADEALFAQLAGDAFAAAGYEL